MKASRMDAFIIIYGAWKNGAYVGSSDAEKEEIREVVRMPQRGSEINIEKL